MMARSCAAVGGHGWRLGAADRRSANQGCRVALTSLPVVGAASGCTQNVTRNLVVSLASGIVLLI